MLLRFLRLFLALLLSQILILFLLLFGLGALVGARDTGPVVKANSALSVRLAGDLIEYPTLPTIPILHEEPLSQFAILEGLKRAASDARIAAVLLDFEGGSLGWGKAAELRGAVQRFRESGKQVWAYGPVLNEVDFYLAAACDSIFLPPQGKLMLNGIGLGAMYFKGLLDKAGVHPNVHRIGAYKDAAEPFLRKNMSEASRRQTTWLLDDLWEEFLKGVGESRKVERTALEQAIEQGALQPDQAVALHLVDGVRQRQDLAARFGQDGGEPRLVPIESYRRARAGRSRGGSGRGIAVVHTRGLILGGKNSFDPVFGTILGAATAVRDLQAAAADDHVAAIVLRIDSPGGEAVASDMIGHAVERARARKPVVVSMVDVAASGGYMMAYRANRIVALPTTITGSIGSITGKFNVRGLYDKLGLTEDFVTRGQYPFLYSDYFDWSAREESLIVRQHWQDYRRWIEDVARRRGLSTAEVDSLGRGRVWTGRQALDRKLVDEIGDQRHAIEVAQELAGLPRDATPRLVHYPKEKGLVETLLEERGALLSGALERWAHGRQLPRSSTWSVLDLDVLP